MGAARTLFGLETEYSTTAIGPGGRVQPLEPVVRHILGRAAQRPHLSGAESGIFLTNAARLYLDVGLHVEYAAPESTNPWDAVRYALAGDRLLAQFAEEVAGVSSGIECLLVRKGNVDYATGTTTASHENYLHRRRPHEVRLALLPHLVSRLVITGGGGLDPFDRARTRFVLSPRASFLQRPIGSSGMGHYALVDERDQPHCAGFHRQHLMCGDASQSHLSAFLRFGTTALVLALIEAGHEDGADVTPADSLAALMTVARDVTLRARLPLVNGRSMTAIDIQRHYVRQARAHPECLPPWGTAVLDAWQDTLDRLERGADAVADRLDWAIKLAIFRDRARRRGQALAVHDDEAGHSDEAGGAEQDAGWRAELCEVDYRFGQVHPPGLFDALDRAGVLRHRVAGVDDVERAMSMAPAEGRAQIRGTVVARLASRHSLASCGWDRIWDPASLRALDLSDPFADVEVWHDLAGGHAPADKLVAQFRCLVNMPQSPATRQSIRQLAERFQSSGPDAPSDCSGSHAIDLNNCAFDLRNVGRFEEAEELMRAALAIDLRVRPAHNLKVPHRLNNLATVLLMQGRSAEARELVRRAWQHEPIRRELTGARILTIRVALAIVDGEDAAPFVGQLKTLLAAWPLSNDASVDLRWQMGPVLDALERRLEPEAVTLLRAIVCAMNGDRPIASLASAPRWDATPAEPLETPWPRVSPRQRARPRARPV